MKTYTNEEILILEENLQTMIDEQENVTLDDLSQNNLNELNSIYNLICGEFTRCQGEDYSDIAFPSLSEMTEKTLKSITSTLINASKGLVIVAKSRRV